MEGASATSGLQEWALAAPAIALRRLVDMVLPPRCPCCSATITGTAGVCGRCWQQIEFIAPPFCTRLGTPFPYDPGESAESPAAIANPPDFDRARAVARHDGHARTLIHALKFRDRLEIADMLAAWMARAGSGLLSDCQNVIPVPLHRQRLFSRRFNQSALLAERIARRAGLDYAPFALARIKPTRQQIGLSARQRHGNVAGAFRIASQARPAIVGRRILLVDDVLTTGATVNACARACRKAGAMGVDVLVFARVVGQDLTTI
jgi:ComF family protein